MKTTHVQERLLLSNYKAPLERIPEEKGVGYYGALTMSEYGTFVQCHICGDLYQNLGLHVSKIHSLKPMEYRIKFKLAHKTSLTSEVERERRKLMGLRNWNNLPQATKDKFIAAARKYGTEYNQDRSQHLAHTLETKNKRGNCPEQILDMIRAISNKAGKQVGVNQFRKETKELGAGGLFKALQKTFGTWNNAVKLAGYTPLEPTKPRKFAKEELVLLLKQYYEREGKIPTYGDCQRGYLPHASQYVRYCGGMRKARRLAGIK